MPALLVTTIAEKTGIPIAEAEHRWKKAKAITNDEKGLNPSDGDVYWRYVTGVFKKAMGVSETGAVLESVDSEAHKAATSHKNDLPEPTAAQIEAGNYKKGHISIHGMNISIENPKGSKRRGVSRDGKAWESTIHHHYGYIKGTVGRDKDHIDVFIGDKPESPHVYVINQVDPATGAFDEHKVMLGFEQRDDAYTAYHANYEKGWKGMGSMTTLSMVDFKDWLENGNTKMVLESATPNIETDSGETPANKLLSQISKKTGSQKDNLFLSVRREDRSVLLECAIMKLPPGVYTLSIDGMAAPSLIGLITSKYGVHAGIDITERFVRGLAVKYPKKIKANFTLGLQEIIISGGLITESIVQPNQKPTVSQDQSKKAMKFTLDTQKNTKEGISRPDVGWIAFLWGNPGTAPLFADGDGLARIIAKQDFEKKYLDGAPSGRNLCMRLVDIVTRGYIKRKYGPSSRPKIDFSWQGEVATVSWEPARKTWYLSAWREDWGGILESAGDRARDQNLWKNGICNAKSMADINLIFEFEFGVTLDDNQVLESGSVTKPLRETAINVASWLFSWLKIQPGKVFADCDALRQKHPDQFKTSQDVYCHVQYVLEKPTEYMEATKPEYMMIIRSNGAPKVAVVDLRLKGGKYRVKSAYTLAEGQLEAKREKVSARGGRSSTGPANPILENHQPLTQGPGTPFDVRPRTDKEDGKLCDRAQSYHLSEETPSAISGQSFSGKRIKPTGDDVNKIFEGVEVDIKGCDWKNKIRIATTFDDIYLAFRDSELMDVSES